MKLLVKFLSIAVALTALIHLGRNWQGTWWVLAGVIQGEYPNEHLSLVVLLLGFTGELTAIAKLCVSYGMYNTQRWARMSGIFVFSADLLLNMYGVVKTLHLASSAPAIDSMPATWEVHAEMTVSMWPTYASIFISTVALASLASKRAVPLFSEADERAEGGGRGQPSN